MIKLKKYLPVLIIGVIALVVTLGSFASSVFGGKITNDVPVKTPTYRTYEFFASSTAPTTVATTTTATSTNILPYIDTNGFYDAGYFVIAGAKKVTLYFNRGGTVQPNTGNTRFEVQVSPDGSNWFNFSKLVQATSSTYQINSTISAATSTQIFGFDNTKDSFYAIRAVVNETTDGEHRVYASAEW